MNSKNVAPILREHIAKEAHLMTDEAQIYRHLGKQFAQHSSVNHSAKEYVRGPVYTNTV